MGKVRVGQIAKELNIKVTDAISRLKELGIDNDEAGAGPGV